MGSKSFVRRKMYEVCIMAFVAIVPVIMLTNVIMNEKMQQNEFAIKGKWEESIVIDEKGLLTPLVVESIKSQGKRLDVYRFGVYVSGKEISQDQLDKIRTSNFPENGIFLGLVMENGKVASYCISYDVQGEVNRDTVAKVCNHFFTRKQEWFTDTINELVSVFRMSEWDLMHYFDPDIVRNRNLHLVNNALEIYIGLLIAFWLHYQLLKFWGRLDEL